MTIYGAVAGGLGDSLGNLFRHPEERKRFARVCRWCPVIIRLRS